MLFPGGRPTNLAHSSFGEPLVGEKLWNISLVFSSFSKWERNQTQVEFANDCSQRSWRTGAESSIFWMSFWDNTYETTILKKVRPILEGSLINLIWFEEFLIDNLRLAETVRRLRVTSCQDRSQLTWTGREAGAAGASPCSVKTWKTNRMTKFIFHCVKQARVSTLTALSKSSAPSAPPGMKSVVIRDRKKLICVTQLHWARVVMYSMSSVRVTCTTPVY